MGRMDAGTTGRGGGEDPWPMAHGWMDGGKEGGMRAFAVCSLQVAVISAVCTLRQVTLGRMNVFAGHQARLRQGEGGRRKDNAGIAMRCAAMRCDAMAGGRGHCWQRSCLQELGRYWNLEVRDPQKEPESQTGTGTGTSRSGNRLVAGAPSPDVPASFHSVRLAGQTLSTLGVTCNHFVASEGTRKNSGTCCSTNKGPCTGYRTSAVDQRPLIVNNDLDEQTLLKKKKWLTVSFAGPLITHHQHDTTTSSTSRWNSCDDGFKVLTTDELDSVKSLFLWMKSCFWNKAAISQAVESKSQTEEGQTQPLIDIHKCVCVCVSESAPYMPVVAFFPPERGGKRQMQEPQAPKAWDLVDEGSNRP
ncbi:hypothetical protein B0T19DRAFT_127260 [Cercophora scortea]|uniref:Uncharacterized protein n=1 Tax=Cercophora scortea TaxID=314031 RepID=A0AAE0MI49_9PEZI|nr:hypothetical protein B0T19DRAFT_127260 [Cercophora scortea]